MAATAFRFREKSQPHSYVRSLSLDLLDPIPPEEILSVGSLNLRWDEHAVRGLLDTFRPERGRLVLEAKAHDPAVVGEDAKWETERWYGTEYCVRKLPDLPLAKVGLMPLLNSLYNCHCSCLLQAIEPNPNAELYLPGRNQYIPQNFDVDKREVAEVQTVVS